MPYDSDLSDAEWKLIAPLFVREKKDGRGRPPGTPFREIVDALCYLSRTGCQWRMLPHDFPDWHFVYQWFRQWCGDETLVKVNTALCKQIRIEDGRDPDPSLGIIDAQSVKSTAAIHLSYEDAVRDWFDRSAPKRLAMYRITPGISDRGVETLAD